MINSKFSAAIVTTLLLTACANKAVVTSFEECEEAGYPVMESFPRQCKAGDQMFIEDVSDQSSSASSESSASSSSASSEDDKSDKITVDAPRANAVISSPLVVVGDARGAWYFEASFPVRLVDADGTVLAAEPAQADGDWMTDEFVPFEASLRFNAPASDTGFVIFEKANASGLPENADELRIPVRFR